MLLLKLNPKHITGEERDLYGHRMVCLNPNYYDDDTPKPIRDWLELIYQSIHNSEGPIINQDNAGIRRAAELISFENLTPEERTLSKNKEAGKITIAKIRRAGAIEVTNEIALNAILAGLDNTLISSLTGLSTDQIEQLRISDLAYPPHALITNRLLPGVPSIG